MEDRNSLPGFKYIEKQIKEATSPLKRNHVLKSNFGVWVGTENPYIDLESWLKLEGKTNLRKDYEVVFGIDLSSHIDLTSISCVQKFPDGHLEAQVRSYIPLHRLDKRSIADSIDYQKWIDSGDLIGVQGGYIDYGFVANHLVDWMSEFSNIRAIAFDQWKWTHFERYLQELGVNRHTHEFISCKQGFQAGASNIVGAKQRYLYMPRMLDIFDSYLAGSSKIIIEPNMPLRNGALSVVDGKDNHMNRKLYKMKSRSKIDPFVALIQAVGEHGDTQNIDKKTDFYKELVKLELYNQQKDLETQAVV